MYPNTCIYLFILALLCFCISVSVKPAHHLINLSILPAFYSFIYPTSSIHSSLICPSSTHSSSIHQSIHPILLPSLLPCFFLISSSLPSFCMLLLILLLLLHLFPHLCFLLRRLRLFNGSINKIWQFSEAITSKSLLPAAGWIHGWLGGWMDGWMCARQPSRTQA